MNVDIDDFRLVPMLEQDWKTQAACRGMDVNLFYPDRGDINTSLLARQVCASCSVAAECAAYAVAVGADTGIWGGFTERERRGRGSRVKMPARCGTLAGYRKHRTLGEPKCEACLSVYAAYVWERKRDRAGSIEESNCVEKARRG